MTDRDIFRDLAVPKYSGAKCIAESDSLMLIGTKLSGFDFSRKKSVKLESVIAFDKHSLRPNLKSHPAELDPTLQGESTSPSGQLCVRFRKFEDKRFIELVGKSSCETLEVTNVHDEFYNDDYFARISWSSDEQKIVYVASAAKKDDSDLSVILK